MPQLRAAAALNAPQARVHPPARAAAPGGFLDAPQRCVSHAEPVTTFPLGSPLPGPQSYGWLGWLLLG